jgi:hypothetical protein
LKRRSNLRPRARDPVLPYAEIPVTVTAKPLNSKASVFHLPVASTLGPAHKRALGVALGIVCGAGVFLITAFHVVFHPTDALEIGLLAQYFYGYRVSWPGAFVGLFWGGVTGFVAGWFLAFVRNFVIGVRMMLLRDKAELARLKDFLDHI